MSNIDLHIHTNFSDGTLTPVEVIRFAQQRELKYVSITDHDNVDAFNHLSELSRSSNPEPFKIRQVSPNTMLIDENLWLFSGIELSCRWQQQHLHLVGLGFDPADKAIRSMIRSQKQQRDTRAKEISLHLQHFGVKNALSFYEQKKSEGKSSLLGRQHFADYLVESGHSSSHKQAFRQYLSDKKVSPVKKQLATDWPEMEACIEAIHNAGGISVLAHPAKYRFSCNKVTLLIEAFQEMGGKAVEVISGKQSQDVTDYLCNKCNQLNLMASCGSDFHHPNIPWTEMGQFPQIPEKCDHVISRLTA